ncbi:hypothetical protein MNBD_GAMMA13-2059 [hydrothermal vent metagenome]|uniref:DUF4197 domain-containing protein n=1 Tax=hydrothermal vent metagenome TaxID=652676 RepID=A0A3B0ZF25_9ZZZZ
MVVICTIGIPAANAGWTDYLGKLKDTVASPKTAASGNQLTSSEMITALKQALNKGTQFAVEKLGQKGGFLNNSQVRIPMPSSLSWVEKSLRSLGQNTLADEFTATMNRAAEQAVPEAAAIFGRAIQAMSVADAKAILSGSDDAATHYFRERTEAALSKKMRPIVTQATEKAGVTSAYKRMTASAGGLGSFLSNETTDIDGYVTAKTLDGLFLMVAEEEKKIRANPLARSTELMKKVFAAYSQ